MNPWSGDPTTQYDILLGCAPWVVKTFGVSSSGVDACAPDAPDVSAGAGVVDVSAGGTGGVVGVSAGPPGGVVDVAVGGTTAGACPDATGACPDATGACPGAGATGSDPCCPNALFSIFIIYTKKIFING